MNDGKLTLTININDIETVEGTDKFEGYTFLNSKKGRFSAIEAHDADGNVFSLKTVFIRPLKTPKNKEKADSKTVQADLMAQMFNELKALRAENAAIKASLPLKTGRKGIAAPQTSVLTKTNGVAHS